MKKLLVVEDDPQLQDLYKQSLASPDIEVHIAPTGADGLTVAKKQPIPDLILLDIMLPGGMNGFDVLEQLKKDEQLKNIPVIVMTSLETEKETALKIGAVDFISKTKTPIEEIVKKVHAHLH